MAFFRDKPPEGTANHPTAKRRPRFISLAAVARKAAEESVAERYRLESVIRGLEREEADLRGAGRTRDADAKLAELRQRRAEERQRFEEMARFVPDAYAEHEHRFSLGPVGDAALRRQGGSNGWPS